MKKRLSVLIALFVFAGVGAAGLPTAAQDAPKPIIIGDINDYSGVADWIRDYWNGVNMAIDEVNAKGGVLGRPLKLVSRDGKLKPDEAVRLAEELRAREGATLLIQCGSSASALALASWVKQNKIPLVVSCSEADSIIWEGGNQYVARTTVGGYAWVAGVLRKALEVYGDELKNKRWVTLAYSHEFGRSLIKSLKEISAQLGLGAQIVDEQWPPILKLAAGPTVAAMNAKKPDIIFETTFDTDIVKFQREAKKRGLTKDRIVIAPTLGFDEHIEMLGKEFPKGVITIGTPLEEMRKKNPALDAFMKDYEERYKKAPRTYTFGGYNGIKVLAAAIEKAGALEADKVAAAFDDLPFQSAYGPEKIRTIDHQATLPFWVGVTDVVNGRGKLTNWTEYNVNDMSPPDAEILRLREVK